MVPCSGFSGDFWLGGKKIVGQWYWMTSPPPQRIAADLMLWEPGQPAHGGDCLQMIAGLKVKLGGTITAVRI